MNHLTVIISEIMVLVADKTMETAEMVKNFKVDKVHTTTNCKSYNADLLYHFTIKPEIHVISDQLYC
jgi:hypothetical protein